MVLLTALMERMNWTVLLRARAHSLLASNQESVFRSIPSATILRIAQTDRTKRVVVSIVAKLIHQNAFAWLATGC